MSPKAAETAVQVGAHAERRAAAWLRAEGRGRGRLPWNPPHVSTTASPASHSCEDTATGFGERNKYDETNGTRTTPSITVRRTTINHHRPRRSDPRPPCGTTGQAAAAGGHQDRTDGARDDC